MAEVPPEGTPVEPATRPGDPRVQRHRPVVATAGALAVVAALAVIAHLTGVAGYRSGPIATATLLALGGGLAAWFAQRPKADRTPTPVLVVVAAALVAAVALTVTAPPSRGRLAAMATGITPLGWVRVASQPAGHSTCRPQCPSYTVTYRPAQRPVVAMGVLVARLRSAGFSTGRSDSSIGILTGDRPLVATRSHVTAAAIALPASGLVQLSLRGHR